MARIAEFKLPDGSCVLVESEDAPRDVGEQRAALETIGKYLSREPDGAPPNLEDRVSPVISTLKTIRDMLGSVGDVEQIEVQAGLKFVGEAGVVISKIGSEASISIKLVWKHTGPPK